MHMKIKRTTNDGQQEGQGQEGQGQEDKKEPNSIKYTYKLGKGISSVKGGIKVLEDLDYPIEIINDTRNMIHGVDVEV